MGRRDPNAEPSAPSERPALQPAVPTLRSLLDNARAAGTGAAESTSRSPYTASAGAEPKSSAATDGKESGGGGVVLPPRDSLHAFLFDSSSLERSQSHTLQAPPHANVLLDAADTVARLCVLAVCGCRVARARACYRLMPVLMAVVVVVALAVLVVYRVWWGGTRGGGGGAVPSVAVVTESIAAAPVTE
jgi:hypothetical protein